MSTRSGAFVHDLLDVALWADRDSSVRIPLIKPRRARSFNSTGDQHRNDDSRLDVRDPDFAWSLQEPFAGYSTENSPGPVRRTPRIRYISTVRLFLGLDEQNE